MAPALVLIGGIVSMMDPGLDPRVRLVWVFVLLPLAVISLGYSVYVYFRDRRGRHDASRGASAD